MPWILGIFHWFWPYIFCFWGFPNRDGFIWGGVWTWQPQIRSYWQ